MKVQIATQLEEEICIICGIIFAIPEAYKEQLKKEHQTFYCPNGHSMYFPAETREEKLGKKLRQERHEVDRLNIENLQLSSRLDGTLDKINKMKKRANAGVCPHCKRHFVNVERHINCKHKDKLNKGVAN